MGTHFSPQAAAAATTNTPKTFSSCYNNIIKPTNVADDPKR